MKVSLKKLSLHELENLLKPMHRPNSKLKSLYRNLTTAHHSEASDESVSCGWPQRACTSFACGEAKDDRQHQARVCTGK